MYVARIDSKYIREHDVRKLKNAYEAKFGERFIEFNYADFPGTKEKCAGQMYKEALEKALQADQPTRIQSRRYTDFDH